MSTAAYDPIAEWYDALVRSSALAGDVVLPHVFTLLGMSRTNLSATSHVGRDVWRAH